MFNIANFLSQILPQQQQMDGYKSAFTADGYCVENKLFFARMSRRKNKPLRRELFV